MDDDRGVYLELLAGQAQRFGLDVLGYCLMSNHVHLIAVPQREESLARAIGGFGCPSARATEVRMGRRIRPLPIGRPKKVVEDEENA